MQKHPKHGSGAMSIQGKSFKKIHENHDNQVCENLTSVARLFVRAVRRDASENPTQQINVEKACW